MGALTVAELVSIAIALFEYGPQFVEFIEKAKAKGMAVHEIPTEHLEQVHAVLAALRLKAASANPVVAAVAEQMGR